MQIQMETLTDTKNGFNRKPPATKSNALPFNRNINVKTCSSISWSCCCRSARRWSAPSMLITTGVWLSPLASSCNKTEPTNDSRHKQLPVSQFITHTAVSQSKWLQENNYTLVNYTAKRSNAIVISQSISQLIDSSFLEWPK